MTDYDLRAMQARMDILLSMTPKEREVHYVKESALQCREEMDELVWQYRWCSDRIRLIKSMAKQAIVDYNEWKDDDALAKVEQFADMLPTFISWKQELRLSIRDKRERLRWLKGIAEKLNRN